MTENQPKAISPERLANPIPSCELATCNPDYYFDLAGLKPVLNWGCGIYKDLYNEPVKLCKDGKNYVEFYTDDNTFMLDIYGYEKWLIKPTFKYLHFNTFNNNRDYSVLINEAFISGTEICEKFSDETYSIDHRSQLEIFHLKGKLSEIVKDQETLENPTSCFTFLYTATSLHSPNILRPRGLSSDNAKHQASDVAGSSEIKLKTIAALENSQPNKPQAISDALKDIDEVIQKQKSLATQATSGSLTDLELGLLDQEFLKLKPEMDSIFKNANMDPNVEPLILLDGKPKLREAFNVPQPKTSTTTQTENLELYTQTTAAASSPLITYLNPDDMSQFILSEKPAITQEVLLPPDSFPQVEPYSDLYSTLALGTIGALFYHLLHENGAHHG